VSDRVVDGKVDVTWGLETPSDGCVVRAEAVIVKSMTSSKRGLDHITNGDPQRCEVVLVIGVTPYRQSCGLVSGRKTQDHNRHRRAKRCSSARSEPGALWSSWAKSRSERPSKTRA
jgi:hypothetical protein